MNSFVKASLIAAMMTAPLMADESFGGVGITIYQVREGVHVAEVIPGTPAAETNLRAGDIITSVDGVSLKGQDIEFSKSKLRGQVNKPLDGEGLGQQGCQELVWRQGPRERSGTRNVCKRY